MHTFTALEVSVQNAARHIRRLLPYCLRSCSFSQTGDAIISINSIAPTGVEHACQLLRSAQGAFEIRIAREQRGVVMGDANKAGVEGRMISRIMTEAVID